MALSDNQIVRLLVLKICLCLWPDIIWANELFVSCGNIYLKTADAQTVQLTQSRLDASPSLSPDGNSIVFVRDTPGITISTGSFGDSHATELWLLTIKPRTTRLLLRGKEDQDLKMTLAGLSSPQFSPDGNFVYFLSEAWATSDTVQKLSLKTNRVQFLTDGLTLDVIPAGKLKGYLLVNRGLIKLDKNGETLGRDSYLWLVSPDGSLIREIGQAESASALAFRKMSSGN